MIKQFEKIRKILTTSQIYQDFDIAAVLRDSIGAYSWKSKEGFWASISGIASLYSKDIYTNINLLAQNLVDIETCNVHALKSLAKMVNGEHITDFIVLDYPKDLQKLIDLFSVPKHILFSTTNEYISKYATADIIGTFDLKNKDIYNEKYGYPKLLFYEILLHLDEIRYLLLTLNKINFNFSFWNYTNLKNTNYKFVSIIGLILNTLKINLNETEEKLDILNISYTAPSLNKIFELLLYLKNTYQKRFDIESKKKNLKKLYNIYDIFYQESYNNAYLADTLHILLTKDYIIEKCCLVNLYKDFLYLFDKDSEIYENNLENNIFFGWSPYPLKVLYNLKNYKLFNDLNIDKNLIFINPFLALISVLKNIIYDKNTGKKLKLTYIDNKSKNVIDLTFLILNIIQSIQLNNHSYYLLVMTYHFYGLFYDMLINDYLKNLWHVYADSNNLFKETFIGTYSEYTKEDFVKKLPLSLKEKSKELFFNTGIIFFNQYQLDFINYLNIINNNLALIGLTELFPYIISYYNNNFDLTAIKNSCYNNHKRKLLGFLTNIIYLDNLSKIDNIKKNKQQLKLNVDKSLLYKIAMRFANYCNQIRIARLSLKTLVQNYAKIGTNKIIENLVKEYFYKLFSNKSDWNMYSLGDNLSELSSVNLFKNINDFTTNNLEILIILYFDKTNYLNIYNEKEPILNGYKTVSTLVLPITVTGYIPSTLYFEFNLREDVYVDIKDISGNLVFNNKHFDEIVSSNNIDNYIMHIYQDVVSVSSVTLIKDLKENATNGCMTAYYYANLYITNGYLQTLSANWQILDMPAMSGKSYYESDISGHILLYEKLNNNMFLSSLYNDVSYKDEKLSSILEDKKIHFIPKDTLVRKYLKNDLYYLTVDYISSDIKLPVYIQEEITGFYNHKFWNINQKDEDLLKQMLYWQKYFPKLNNFQLINSKKIYFKQNIYPFICEIMLMNAVSGFSGLLSGMQKEYIGNNKGDKELLNITNTEFPTIAGIQQISNLVDSNEITKLHNTFINIYLNNYYSDINLYTLNILALFLNSVDITNNSNLYKHVDAWKDNYTTFVGYNTVYGQSIKNSLSKKSEGCEGPWIYDALVNFIKLFENYTVSYDIDSFSEAISLLKGYKLIGDTKINSEILYNITYNNIKKFVEYFYYNIIAEKEKQLETFKLYIYQYDILRMNEYRIYDYKEDIYGNAFTLFKHYKFNKYEDAGQIWIRRKNYQLSVPVMLYRSIELSLEYIYDDSDTIVCKEHNIYANILKLLFNNAVQFGIYENKIWILGYSNYIKINTEFIKINNKNLKICVFEYVYDDNKNHYYIKLNTLKFLTYNNIDYIKDINYFVTAYNNYLLKSIDFVIYDPLILNNLLNNRYLIALKNEYDETQLNNYINLNDVSLLFLIYLYNILNKNLFNIKKLKFEHTKYPIIGLFNNKQVVNTTNNLKDVFMKLYNLIGYKVELYKINSNLIFNITSIFEKVALTNIKYNLKNNCVLIIFSNVIDNNMSKKQLDLSKHNIISYYYDGEKIIYFDNIVLNESLNNISIDMSNIFNSFIAVKYDSHNVQYLIKIKLPNYCNCNFKDVSFKEISYINSLINENISLLNTVPNKNIIIKGNINVISSSVAFDSSNIIKQYKNIFNKNNDIHVWLGYDFNKSNSEEYDNHYMLYEYYYIFYLNKNYEILCEKFIRNNIHLLNCQYNNKIQEKNLHIWKSNLNKGILYISYLSINSNIINAADFYKNLYYNVYNQICIDTISYEATFFKRKLDNNTYVNVVDSIKIKYGHDKLNLPFNFKKLDEYMYENDCFEQNEDGTISIVKDLNINWVFDYNVLLNSIHQSYPKCKIENNKIICTTILTKLGGNKNFKNDITHDILSLTFLANYIFNSSIRKKFDYLSNKNDAELRKAFNRYKALLVTPNLSNLDIKYCINDFLFNLSEIPGFSGLVYFEYDLNKGFLDILDLFSALTYIINNDENLFIDDINIKKYIESTLEYKREYNKENNKENKNLFEGIAFKNALNSIDCKNFFNKGITYKINSFNKILQKNYLNFVIAMPSFTDCFTDNLKVFINFGLLTNLIKNFITGSLSFDLDSSIYIDDSEFDNILILKKVGWFCGYNKTNYISWKSGDNKYGGPEIYEIDLIKYRNYLINKFVLQNQINKKNYELIAFNNIASNIKIHLEVCWFNLSILRSLNPTVDIYWKGMYLSEKVNKRDIMLNRKCCLNSWSKLINVDLTNNIFRIDSGNTLYPVFATLLLDKKLYNIYTISAFNIIDNKFFYDSTDEKPWLISNESSENINKNNFHLIVFDLLLSTYNLYNITDKQFNDYCILKYNNDNELKAKYHNTLTSYSQYTNLLLLNYLSLLVLRQTKEYKDLNEKMLLSITYGNVKDILPTCFQCLSSYKDDAGNTINTLLLDNYYDIFVKKYSDTILECFNNFSNLFNSNLYINKLYVDFPLYRKDFKQIYNDKINILIKIYSFNYLKPKRFIQYYTNIENILAYLNKLKTKSYYPNLPMELTGDNAGALHVIYNLKENLDDRYSYCDYTKQYGYILLVLDLKGENIVKRNIIITDFNKLIKADEKIDLKISNYYTIKLYVDLYLKLTLYIDTENGLLNCYDMLNANYIPGYAYLITPYIKYYMQYRLLDIEKLNIDKKYNNIYSMQFGYYFDMPFAYNKVKYNCLTNNFNVSCINKLDDFYLLSATNDFIITNLFNVLSLDLIIENNDINYYLYKRFADIYEEIGYKIELATITNISHSLPNKIYKITSNRTVETNNTLYSFNNGSVTCSLDLKKNKGIHELIITPYFRIKYTEYLLKSFNVIISNYYDLFSITMPSSSIDKNEELQTLISNTIPLVNTVTYNELIRNDLSLLLKDEYKDYIRFYTHDIILPLSIYYNSDNKEIEIEKIVPESLTLEDGTRLLLFKNNNILLDGITTHALIKLDGKNTYISGIAKNVLNFEYIISAYYEIDGSLYCAGLITGYYIYKDFNINNIFKENKSEFIFTTNMSNKEIKNELLSENTISTVILLTSSIININNKQYSDLDFIKNINDILNNLVLMLKELVINE